MGEEHVSKAKTVATGRRRKAAVVRMSEMRQASASSSDVPHGLWQVCAAAVTPGICC